MTSTRPEVWELGEKNWGELHSGWGNQPAHLNPFIDFWCQLPTIDLTLLANRTPLLVGGECTGAEHIPSEIMVFAHRQHHVASANRNRLLCSLEICDLRSRPNVSHNLGLLSSSSHIMCA